MPKIVPTHENAEKPVPEYDESAKPLPQREDKENPVPEIGHPENMVQFGAKRIEIKPTKLKYQRDRTAAFYKLLQQVPVVELLALQDGVLDPQRSGDKMLFDWLIAVTDDPKLVAANYDRIDSETIHRLLEIFCRLNYIKDQDEKKDQAQMTTP